MGTQMSAHIEYDQGTELPFSDTEWIDSFSEGPIAFPKSYDGFDALAGGRRSAIRPRDRRDSPAPLIVPRGMPSPCSLEVAHNYFYLVAKQSVLPDKYFWPSNRCVSPSVALKWLREKKCHEAEVMQWFNCPPEGQIWRAVSEPGHYNASWLRLGEFDAALRHHRLKLAALPIEYRAVRTVLALLSEELGQERVRLVVWFS